MLPSQNKSLSIFVHRASECLTDHESHGEGLICFSLLKGLAERGHHIYAYSNHAAINLMPERMVVQGQSHRVPANSLAPWEHSWRATRWLKQLLKKVPIDLVWHMNPAGGGGCPRPPQTFGKPLVVGPLYYGWPVQPGLKTAQPRFGVSLQSLVGPLAEKGWQQTLQQSTALFCATRNHAEAMQKQLPRVRVSDLPLIVEPPVGVPARTGRRATESVTLLFVANLVPNKNPMIFCETIQRLRAKGIQANGVLIGDGSERPRLESYCLQVGIKNAICFLGKVPNSQVYQQLSQADFLVSTSFGEPYGRGIAEAMSVGTPAVCHRSGGPADFIEDHRDGLLVDDLTGWAYADKIEQGLTDPSGWKHLSQNALRKAKEWRQEVVLDKLETHLYQVSAFRSLDATLASKL